jgi:hypothetical protein
MGLAGSFNLRAGGGVLEVPFSGQVFLVLVGSLGGATSARAMSLTLLLELPVSIDLIVSFVPLLLLTPPFVRLTASSFCLSIFFFITPRH